MSSYIHTLLHYLWTYGPSIPKEINQTDVRSSSHSSYHNPIYCLSTIICLLSIFNPNLMSWLSSSVHLFFIFSFPSLLCWLLILYKPPISSDSLNSDISFYSQNNKTLLTLFYNQPHILTIYQTLIHNTIVDITTQQLIILPFNTISNHQTNQTLTF